MKNNSLTNTSDSLNKTRKKSKITKKKSKKKKVSASPANTVNASRLRAMSS
jgi:hypothetical protein